jgi:hypothetical protein
LARVHLARIVFRGLGLRSRHSLAVRQDVGNVRFLRPLPPTDFCRLDSTYGHTQEPRYPRPHRIAIPLAGPAILLRWRIVHLRGGVHSAASRRDSVESVGLQPPARLATGTSRGRRSRVKDPRIAWVPLLRSPSSIPRRHPAAAKDLESLPPRRTPPLLLRASDAWPVEVA